MWSVMWLGWLGKYLSAFNQSASRRRTLNCRIGRIAWPEGGSTHDFVSLCEMGTYSENPWGHRESMQTPHRKALLPTLLKVWAPMTWRSEHFAVPTVSSTGIDPTSFSLWGDSVSVSPPCPPWAWIQKSLSSSPWRWSGPVTAVV